MIKRILAKIKRLAALVRMMCNKKADPKKIGSKTINSGTGATDQPVPRLPEDPNAIVAIGDDGSVWEPPTQPEGDNQ